MKVSVYIAATLDGFIAREDGALDWLPGSDGQQEDKGEDYGYKAFMDSVDVLLMGRNTYETVMGFGAWPYGNKRVIVLSNSLNKLDDTLPKTVTLQNASPAELYTELESAGEQHLYIDGGKTIQGFLDAGLVNELIITRIPVLIGSGKPLFGPLHQDVALHHQKTLTYPNGFVQSYYLLFP